MRGKYYLEGGHKVGAFGRESPGCWPTLGVALFFVQTGKYCNFFNSCKNAQWTADLPGLTSPHLGVGRCADPPPILKTKVWCHSWLPYLLAYRRKVSKMVELPDMLALYSLLSQIGDRKYIGVAAPCISAVLGKCT